MKRFFGKRRALTIGVALTAAFVLLASPVLAGGFRTFLAAYPPSEVGWHHGEGVPELRGAEHGLRMAADPGGLGGLALAFIEGAEGITLSTLGFDYRNDSTCTSNSPRFTVETPNGDWFRFGCQGGIHTPAPDDTMNWTRVRFTDLDAVPVDGNTGTWPGFGTVVVQRLWVSFGCRTGLRGCDTPTPDFYGSAHLDNLAVNDVLIGKPGNNS